MSFCFNPRVCFFLVFFVSKITKILLVFVLDGLDVAFVHND